MTLHSYKQRIDEATDIICSMWPNDQDPNIGGPTVGDMYRTVIKAARTLSRLIEALPEEMTMAVPVGTPLTGTQLLTAMRVDTHNELLAKIKSIITGEETIKKEWPYVVRQVPKDEKYEYINPEPSGKFEGLLGLAIDRVGADEVNKMLYGDDPKPEEKPIRPIWYLLTSVFFIGLSCFWPYEWLGYGFLFCGLCCLAAVLPRK